MRKLIASALVGAALLLPPAASASETADDSSARAGVTFCGALGHYIVWYYDANDEYRELWNSCI